MLICLGIITEAEGNPEKYRFQVELEFVQCLANPNYLNCKLISYEPLYQQTYCKVSLG